MKKSILVLAVAVMVMGTMSVAFADASWGPASIFAGEMNITEEEAYEMRVERNKTFGELAKEEGVYEDFKAEALEVKKEMLNQMVKDGEMTQTQANEMIKAFEDCDGTQRQVLKGLGLFGQKAGNGQGNGLKAMDGEGLGVKKGGNSGLGNGQMNGGGRR